jgi:uncharacterized protein (DUF1330 family)
VKHPPLAEQRKSRERKVEGWVDRHGNRLLRRRGSVTQLEAQREYEAEMDEGCG